MKDRVYFISDLHLGAPSAQASRERELRFVAWLEEIRKDARVLYVVGDLFDFWFEYKKAVPRGFTRAIGKLAELADSGIEIHLFTGNHDMWIFDYLPQEIGAQLHRQPIEKEYGGKKFYIGHGDGLGPGDHGYKFIKRVFDNRFLQWCFARLHPNFGIWLADFFSRRSRMHTGGDDAVFKGEENEWLFHHCKDILKDHRVDYFVFGHRHLPLDLKVSEESRYVNLGDWIQYFTYGVFDGEELHLKEWRD